MDRDGSPPHCYPCHQNSPRYYYIIQSKKKIKQVVKKNNCYLNTRIFDPFDWLEFWIAIYEPAFEPAFRLPASHICNHAVYARASGVYLQYSYK